MRLDLGALKNETVLCQISDDRRLVRGPAIELVSTRHHLELDALYIAYSIAKRTDDVKIGIDLEEFDRRDPIVTYEGVEARGGDYNLAIFAEKFTISPGGARGLIHRQQGARGVEAVHTERRNAVLICTSSDGSFNAAAMLCSPLCAPTSIHMRERRRLPGRGRRVAMAHRERIGEPRRR